MAAEVLAREGAGVTVYERMPSVGRKFLLAGRGGLNLTHSEELSRFLSRYGVAPPHLRAAIEAFPPAAVRAWCETLGQDTFVGSSGRVFPKSFKTSPLLRAWLRRLDGMGVAFKLRHRWTGWTTDGDAAFDTPDGAVAIRADAVVLALGGASWARLGSDGGWVEPFVKDDIKVAPLRPANCGFLVEWSDIFRDRFEGQPLKAIGLSFAGQSVRGEAIVTRRGLEGGGVYALSSVLREAIAANGEAVLQIALRPDLTTPDLENRLQVPRLKQSFSTFLRKAVHLSPAAIGLLHEAAPGKLTGMNAASVAHLIQCRSGAPRRHSAARSSDLDRRRRIFRRGRRGFHGVAAPRRVRRGRDARLGGADRRLPVAGFVFNRRRSGARRNGMARSRR